MVLYTLTTAMVEALENLQSIKQFANSTTSWSSDTLDKEKLGQSEQQQRGRDDPNTKDVDHAPNTEREINLEEPLARQHVTDGLEPSLSSPFPGNPISHGQILNLWMATKTQNVSSTTLDALMRGSRVYIAPPKPKQEPARLSAQIRSIKC